MNAYDYDTMVQFVHEEDVKFIRLAFVDVFGVQKNISIMPGELERSFRDGISFDASSIEGFGDEVQSDLFLFPDPKTMSILPWRPSNGRVARMYCDIKYPDGRSFEKDSRLILKKAIAKARERQMMIDVGPEIEFYLFKTDDDGNPTKIPFDEAGYMDIAPEDKGENVRREICFNLIDMGIRPETSHHAAGPGQNEVDFRYSDALTAADNTETFKWVVKTAAMGNGLHADFSPKPLRNDYGNSMHINISIENGRSEEDTYHFMAGIMEHIREMTLFLNPTYESYERFGSKKAPKYITWSRENRSQLIRIPATKHGNERIELRSPDPMANPYLVTALLIYAGLDGIEHEMNVPDAVDVNLRTADTSVTKNLKTLPLTLSEAIECAKNSEFIKGILPDTYIETYSNIGRQLD